LVEWSIDKRYLNGLAAAGIPVVPTEFVAVGESVERWPDMGVDLVLKPSVGAGANGVVRTHGDVALAQRHISALHASGRTVMVQPYVGEIDGAGETGLVFLGGRFGHAFGKAAILAGAVVFEDGLFAREQIEPRIATPAELAVGERVVASLGPTAYARVDLLPTADGPAVLEVEVTEPSLYLNVDAGAVARAASVFRNLAS
jgi:glutathione synthase/RimK-type ligase-like ATP-grasp enzyme